MTGIRVCLGFICVFLLGVIGLSAQSDAQIIADLVGEINDWRIVSGLEPLAYNETLERLASRQADYVDSLDRINNFHIDAQGNDERDRSQLPEFAWETYGHPLRIAVTEIAAIGSVDSAMSFWQSSDVHTRSALGERYREVGVAIRERPNGDILFLVVFGGQPNVLPALVDVESNFLRLTTERNEWTGNWIGQVTQFRLIDENGIEITEWQDWRPSIPLPDEIKTDFIVEYVDADGTTVQYAVRYSPIWSSLDLETEDIVEDVVDEPSDIASDEPLVPINVELNPDADVIRELLAEINAWRIVSGLEPLAYNETLERLASRQADYVNSLDRINNFHIDAQGNDERDRSQLPEFAWETYGHPLRIAVTEIAAIGSIDSAMDFWQSSDIHTRSALGERYREVGVAIRERPSGDILFLVVFGGQPNVLPAFVDVDDNRLRLTTERNEWTGNWIGQVTRFRLLDENAVEIMDWQDWQPSIDLPDEIEGDFIVEYEDADGTTAQYTVLYNPIWSSIDLENAALLADAEVNIASDEPITDDTSRSPFVTNTPFPQATTIVQLFTNTPVSLDLVTSTPEQPSDVPTSTPTDTVAPSTNTPQPIILATSTQRPTRTPTFTPSPTLTQTPSPIPSATATPIVERVLLVYSNDDLTLINPNASVIDLSAMSISDGNSSIDVSRWDAFGGGSFSVSELGSGHCVQAWSWDSTGFAQPNDCRLRWGVLTFNPDAVPWNTGKFDVLIDGAVIATCQSSAERCEVTLP